MRSGYYVAGAPDGSFRWTVKLSEITARQGSKRKTCSCVRSLVERTQPSWVEEEWWLGSRIKDWGKYQPGHPVYDMCNGRVSSLHLGDMQRERCLQGWGVRLNLPHQIIDISGVLLIFSPSKHLRQYLVLSKNLITIWWETNTFSNFVSNGSEYNSSQM